MASKISLDSFLAVVKRSNLVSSDQLKTLRESYLETGGEPDNARKFAEYLVKQNVLTVWQAEKLLQGKHKGFFLGKYRLLALLGKGGMSSVYLAEHVLMRRRCAIKVLPTRRVHDSSYLGRFHREAQAVASLDDPNIVRAYDVDHEVDGEMEIHFLVMEYVNGKSLLDLVQKQRFLSPVQSAEYIRQAARGLQHAHAAGLVHRDIKPGNLLVDNSGVVKLLDLGLARFFEGNEETSLTVQHDERVLGTADYLAPEQAVDSHQVDARADIYSLGCTLYFCLTGHPPFTQGTLAQRLLAHQTKEPTRVETERPEVPASLGEILRKMMAKEPDDRYQTAGEVADVLDRWLLDQPGAVQPGGDSGSRQTGSTAASEQETPPMIKRRDQKQPPAGRKNKEPVSQQDAVEPELGAFLTHLDEESSVTSLSSTPPPQRRTAPSESKPAAKTDAAAVSVVDAEPVEDAEPAESSAVALPADSSIPRNQPAKEAVVEAEAAESGTGGSRLSGAAVAPRRSMKKPSMPLLIGGGVAAVVVLAVVVAMMSGGNGSGENEDREVIKPPPEEPEPRKELGPELAVGSEGDFQTISAALEYIEDNPDRFTGPETWSITVAGGETYDERISIEGGGFSALPRGLTISSSGDEPAVLSPSEDGPIIDLNGIEGLTIRGLRLDAAGRQAAIRLEGFLVGTRLEDIEVRGVSQFGIDSTDVAAIDGQPLQLVRIEFVGTSSTATGIRLGDARQLRIDGCRFVGPMNAGIEKTSSSWNSDVDVRHCIFSNVQVGVLFSGPPQDVQRVALVNNTFHKVQRGIVFQNMPQPGSSGLLIAHNLFTELTGPEASVDAGLDAGQFEALLSTAAGDRNNWSDRAVGENEASAVDIFGDDGRRGIEAVPFASRDPSADNFLKPTDPRVRSEVNTPTAGADPWVGAAAP